VLTADVGEAGREGNERLVALGSVFIDGYVVAGGGMA